MCVFFYSNHAKPRSLKGLLNYFFGTGFPVSDLDTHITTGAGVSYFIRASTFEDFTRAYKEAANDYIENPLEFIKKLDGHNLAWMLEGVVTKKVDLCARRS